MFYPLTLRDFLDRAETVFPDRIAVVDEPDQPAQPWGELTYRQIGERARSQAAWLDSLNIPVGARVAIVSHNSARMLTSFFGVSAWGRVLVPINFRLLPEEIRYIVEHSQAEVLLLDPALKELAASVPCAHTRILGESDEEIFGSTTAPQEWVGDEGATATLNYTSGTTARPKGVQLTHRNLWLNAVIFGLHSQLTEEEVYLHTLPMFHANGWGMPYAITGLGGRHIPIRQIDGAEILRRVQRHGVTLMCAAPTVIDSILLAAQSWTGDIPGRDLVRVVVAGAPPPTRTIERVRSELGWEFLHLYGLTETSPFLTMSRMRPEWESASASEQARLLGRAGAPGLGVRISLDPTGEVLAQSNHALESYWRNPEATEDAQADNWFHTGDGGTIIDGYLSITDRKKDVIITGGENVSSIEVEDVLMSHPAVREVAVIGIPDEKWGEQVLADVVTDGTPLTEAQLIAHCQLHLARYKCPKKINFLDSLPRTATGKLQKFKLRQNYLDQLNQ
jgi:fatty-acyl-CoA synthase